MNYYSEKATSSCISDSVKAKSTSGHLPVNNLVNNTHPSFFSDIPPNITMEDDGIKPSDSVLHRDSSTTFRSSQSSRLRATAKKVALMAKQKLLKQKHSIELEQQRLKARAEQLELQLEINTAAAEENVYASFEQS